MKPDRFRPGFLVGALLLAGCSAPPQRRDPFANLTISNPSYKNLRVALVLSSNTEAAIPYFEKAKRELAFVAGFDADTVFKGMGDILLRNFKEVVKVEKLEDVQAIAPDVIAVLDVYGAVGRHTGAKTKVEVAVIFMTPDKLQVDVIEGKGIQTVPFPNYTAKVVEAAAEAQDDFEKALQRSGKLAELNRSKSQAAPVSMPARVPVVASAVDLPAYRLAQSEGQFALVVGIDQYKSLPPADFAVRDAQAVKAHLLALGYPERNVILLTGDNATRTGLQKYLDEWLPRNVRPDSTVFIYFSGHGAPNVQSGEAYLVPWDGDPQFLQSTAYSLKELYASLGRLKAKSVIVALDSCFSGAGGRSVLAKGARPLVTRVESLGESREGMTILAAASGDEITSGLDEQGHGIFTYYFLRGLSEAARDASGAVTARGLHAYLKPRVQDAARRQNREQTPQLWAPSGDQVLRRP